MRKLRARGRTHPTASVRITLLALPQSPGQERFPHLNIATRNINHRHRAFSKGNKGFSTSNQVHNEHFVGGRFKKEIHCPQQLTGRGAHLQTLQFKGIVRTAFSLRQILARNLQRGTADAESIIPPAHFPKSYNRSFVGTPHAFHMQLSSRRVWIWPTCTGQKAGEYPAPQSEPFRIVCVHLHPHFSLHTMRLGHTTNLDPVRSCAHSSR